jgi:hypothetical protein
MVSNAEFRPTHPGSFAQAGGANSGQAGGRVKLIGFARPRFGRLNSGLNSATMGEIK